jgi:hypothetical protein
MTLDQFQDLKLWHLRHGRDAPLEAVVWNVVLSLWLAGFVGAPVSVVLGVPEAMLATVLLAFLPGRYVAARTALHRSRRLRCDWLVTLR